MRLAVPAAVILAMLVCGNRLVAEIKPRAIVVLPFDASGLAPGDQWMGEGVAQMVSLGLAQHAAFVQIERCMPGTVDHKGVWSTPLVHRVAKAVQADAALHGRIGRKDAELVLEPALLDPTSGQTAFLESLTFAEADLSARIAWLPAIYARGLHVTLSDDESARMEKAARPTHSLRALELFTRGKMAYNAGANDSAVMLLMRAMEADGNFAAAQYTLGRVHMSLGNNWNARDRLRAAMLLDLTMPEPAKALGDLHLIVTRRKGVDLAIEYYSRAIQLRPFYADAHVGLGDTKAVQGDLDGALASYQAALTFDPFNARAHLRLGRIHAHKGRSTESVNAYEQAVRLQCRSCWQTARPTSPMCEPSPVCMGPQPPPGCKLP